MADLLVVDDERSLLEAIEALLSMAGHRVQAVPSGQAALDALRARGDDLPELIITDVAMHNMTGLQLRDAVRTSVKWGTIPFLFLSASITPQMEEQIADLEDASFLRKPFEPDELYEAVAARFKTR